MNSLEPKSLNRIRIHFIHQLCSANSNPTQPPYRAPIRFKLTLNFPFLRCLEPAPATAPKLAGSIVLGFTSVGCRPGCCCCIECIECRLLNLFRFIFSSLSRLKFNHSLLEYTSTATVGPFSMSLQSLSCCRRRLHRHSSTHFSIFIPLY